MSHNQKFNLIDSKLDLLLRTQRCKLKGCKWNLQSRQQTQEKHPNGSQQSQWWLGGRLKCSIAKFLRDLVRQGAHCFSNPDVVVTDTGEDTGTDGTARVVRAAPTKRGQAKHHRTAATAVRVHGEEWSPAVTGAGAPVFVHPPRPAGTQHLLPI